MVIVILIILGLCFGSFVNAFVWRFHEQAELRHKQDELRAQLARTHVSSKEASKHAKLVQQNAELKAHLADLSIATGRSMCVHCHHELAARDLMPVVSYLTLRGKCRYCQRPIQDTPIAELVTPLLFVISYVCWPVQLHGADLLAFVIWLICLVGFVALGLYDLRWYELPHRIVLPLIGLVAAAAIVTALVFSNVQGGGWHSLMRAGWGAAIGGGIFWLLYVVSPTIPTDEVANEAGSWAGTTDVDPVTTIADRLVGLLVGGKYSKWIGFGDITLGLLLGLLVGGPGNALLLIFIASLIGTLVAMPLLLSGRADRTSHLPFGPFLMLAAVVVKLFGASLISWYTSHLLG
jgi:leader peptidase (prepilin peptidase)/N-methyltransferase